MKYLFRNTSFSFSRLPNWFFFLKSVDPKEATSNKVSTPAEEIFNFVLPAFSDMKVDTVTETDVYDFIASRQKSGLSNRYIADILIMMKSVFKYASKTYHFLNPLDGITLPKMQKPEIELLDEKQQGKLQQTWKNSNNLAEKEP